MAVSAEQRARWTRIVRAYQAGENMDAIAHREGVDRKTVYNVARRAGLPNRHCFDADRRARIVDAHRAGLPLRQIAGQEGVSTSQITAMARRAGIPPRPAPRRYPLDDTAFDQPSDIGWWLIGLLAADGCISSRGSGIFLCQREADVDVLFEFLRYVGSPDRPLTELKLYPAAAARAWPRSRAFEARVFSRHMQAALARHGIVPLKTKSLLDGDGSVRVESPAGPLISFYGTPMVMTQCSRFWGSRLSFRGRRRPSVRSHRGGLGWVALHQTNAVRAAEILLASSPVSLQRKRRSLEAIVARRPVGS